MGTHKATIEARSTTEDVRRGYDFRSYFYPWVISPFLEKTKRIASDRAEILPRDQVLEVAIGPGNALRKIAPLLAPGNTLYGVDLSPKMVQAAQRRLESAGYRNHDLRVADARDLPFPEQTFDVVLNSYMLDILPLEDLPVVLAEFFRVLRPGGQLVLVNVSKQDEQQRTWRERIYTMLPSSWVPFVHGGSRPIFMEALVHGAGFQQVHREFVHHIVPSEIITARRPAPVAPSKHNGNDRGNGHRSPNGHGNNHPAS